MAGQRRSCGGEPRRIERRASQVKVVVAPRATGKLEATPQEGVLQDRFHEVLYVDWMNKIFGPMPRA